MIVMFHHVRGPRRCVGPALPLLGLLVATLGGCGGGDAAESGLVPVKGRVTRDGGPWPTTGAIYFVPQKALVESRQGVGTFDPSGQFDSVEGGYGGAKGLHPGYYWVYVKCKEGDEEMPIPGKTVAVKDHVPAKYQDPARSGLTLEVAAGKPVEVNFDVKTK